MVEVHVGLGEEPEQGANTLLYRFKTQEELEAFKLGLRCAVTWFEVECFHEERCYSPQRRAWLPAPEYIEFQLTAWRE